MNDVVEDGEHKDVRVNITGSSGLSIHSRAKRSLKSKASGLLRRGETAWKGKKSGIFRRWR